MLLGATVIGWLAVTSGAYAQEANTNVHFNARTAEQPNVRANGSMRQGQNGNMNGSTRAPPVHERPGRALCQQEPYEWLDARGSRLRREARRAW